MCVCVCVCVCSADRYGVCAVEWLERRQLEDAHLGLVQEFSIYDPVALDVEEIHLLGVSVRVRVSV